MKSPLFDSVNRLAIEIVNASTAEDEKTLEKGYAELRKLCFKNENTEKDHPLQWEALGDFSASNTDSIASYEKGLIAARNLHLPEYEASILPNSNCLQSRTQNVKNLKIRKMLKSIKQ